MVTDAELSGLLVAIAAKTHPYSTNNNWARTQGVRDLLRVFENITPEEYAEIYKAIYNQEPSALAKSYRGI